MSRRPNPREYTADEVREMLLSHIHGLCGYWRTCKTDQDRLEALAFSILVALDGGSLALPVFAVIPMPHEDDKLYHIENGENWVPEFTLSVRKGAARRARDGEICDIGGVLHEHFLKQPEGGNT